MIVCDEHKRELPVWATYIVDTPEYGDLCEPCHADLKPELQCRWLPVLVGVYERDVTGRPFEKTGEKVIGDWVCADGTNVVRVDGSYLPNEWQDDVDMVEVIDEAVTQAMIDGGYLFEYHGEEVRIS